MDFNVKKLAADAGTFLSRAVQVLGLGGGGDPRGRGGDVGAPSPRRRRPPHRLADRSAGELRPEARVMGAAWCPSRPGRPFFVVPPTPPPNRRSPESEAGWGQGLEFPPAPGGHLEFGLEPGHSTARLSDPTTRVLV